MRLGPVGPSDAVMKEQIYRRRPYRISELPMKAPLAQPGFYQPMQKPGMMGAIGGQFQQMEKPGMQAAIGNPYTEMARPGMMNNSPINLLPMSMSRPPVTNPGQIGAPRAKQPYFSFTMPGARRMF